MSRGRLDVEQQADGIDALVDHHHVDGPEEQEAEYLGPGDAPGQGGTVTERRIENAKDLVNRAAADPGLDAKPAAGDERAQERGNVGAGGSK